MTAKAKPRRHMILKSALSFCGIVLLVGIFGVWLYFSPVSAISIDVNPSLELSVNRFDRVIGIEGFNDEGKLLAGNLSVRSLDYKDAVKTVICDPVIQDFIAKGQDVSVVVVCEDEERSGRMLEAVETYVGQPGQVHCHASGAGTSQDHATAHAAGLSCGKYQVYLSLYELDPSVTLEQAASMTMAELRSRIKELGGQVNNGCGHHSSVETNTSTASPEVVRSEEPKSSPESQKGYMGGHGHGNGNGNGQKRRRNGQK